MHFVSLSHFSTSPFAAPLLALKHTMHASLCHTMHASLYCVCLPLLLTSLHLPTINSLCYTDPWWVYLSPFPTTPSVLHLFGSNSWGRKATDHEEPCLWRIHLACLREARIQYRCWCRWWSRREKKIMTNKEHQRKHKRLKKGQISGGRAGDRPSDQAGGTPM